ncbi:MAG: hypothetical protein ACLS37_11290 [Alistipes sp.]
MLLSWPAALLTVGCGETDKPDENTGGGSGTGGGTADRLITRLDITYTSTDGIDATEWCTFTYDELKRLTVLERRYVERPLRRRHADLRLFRSGRHRFQRCVWEDGEPIRETTNSRLDAAGRFASYHWRRFDARGRTRADRHRFDRKLQRCGLIPFSASRRRRVSDNTYFTWRDGNMVSARQGSQTDTATYGVRANDKTNLDLNWLLYGTESFCTLLGNDDDGINFPLIGRMGNRSRGYLATTRLDLSQGGSEIRRYDYTFDADGYPTRIVCTVETKTRPVVQMRPNITYTITYDN